MRDVYAASVELGTPDQPLADPKSAAGMVLQWVSSKYGQGAPADWQRGELVSGSDRAAWTIDEVAGDPRRLWYLEWRQVGDTGDVVWVIRCQLAGVTAAWRFTIRIAVDSTDDRLAPARYEVGRPRVLTSLAGTPGIHLDGVRLTGMPTVVGSDEIPGLVDALRDPARKLPIVVLTPGDDTGRSLVSARRMADRLVGIAHVVEIVARPVTFLLTDQVGPVWSVFGGAVRLYWPDLSLDGDPYEHPLWLPMRIVEFETSPRPLISRIERLISSVAVIRIGADPLGAELRALRDASMVARLENIQGELQRVSALSTEPPEDWLAELQRAYDEATSLGEEARRLQRENTDLQAEVDALRRSFIDVRQSMEQAAPEPEPDETAAEPASSTEAFEAARTTLRNLVIPESAGAELRDLDAAPEGRSWGRTAWKAFRALDAYVNDHAEYAGFWDWCERSPNERVWPASPKKLAMNESKTVINSATLREKRRFAVDERVDESGSILMFAHIKVSEGGGPGIPRIYFHDDTRGTTGRVHVGFFGPHRLVPNKGAN